MDIRNRRGLKEAADRSLAAASYNPKKLILIHTAAALALSLLVTALDFVLNTRIAGTGGLGGIELRSVLSTVQSVLRLANLVILPFWEAGYTFAAMNIARGKRAEPGSLLEGFRRWGPVFRATLFQWLIYMGIAMICLYVSMQIFLITPLADPLYEILAPYMTSTAPVLDQAAMSAATAACMPMLWIFGVLYALLVVPVVYQYRMVSYVLLDGPKTGALAALRESRRIMRGSRFRLFKLDLSFWWFYGAQLLLALVCYGDAILPALGIGLPFSDTVSYFLFYILSLAFQMALYIWLRNRVAVTYAHGYDVLRGPEAETAAPAPPRNQPWSY